MLKALLIASLLVSPTLASGQARKKGEPQVINFEDDTITGDLSKPDGEYVEARKKVKHSNLIRIREEFKDKVLQSVSDL